MHDNPQGENFYGCDFLGGNHKPERTVNKEEIMRTCRMCRRFFEDAKNPVKGMCVRRVVYMTQACFMERPVTAEKNASQCQDFINR